MLEEDGWYLVAQRGSHRHFRHPVKPGRTTVAGHPNDDLAPGILNSIYKRKNERRSDELKQYLVIIEKASNNYSAYIPDIPGCVATGETVDEVKTNIAEALRFHLEGLAEDGIITPEPSAKSDYITA